MFDFLFALLALRDLEKANKAHREMYELRAKAAEAKAEEMRIRYARAKFDNDRRNFARSILGADDS